MNSLSGLRFNAATAPPAVSPNNVSAARLKDACSDFESIFISMIMRQMLDSIPKSGPSLAGADLMQTLADQAVASHIAKSGGIGLSDVLYKQLAASFLHDGTKV